METTRNETHKKEKIEKKKQSSGTISRDLRYLESQKERRWVAEKIFEEIMIENFTNL